VSNPTEETFADGNMNPVVRIGDEVRRSLPGSWRGSHAVLRHLAARNFPFSPRVLRHDASHEWLTYLPGHSIGADLLEDRSDSLVEQAGRLIRRYHDAMADFVIPPDAGWIPQIGIPDESEVVCHSDIAPWNVVVQNGEITGLIDWDLVHPGPRMWDLAYAAWRFAPLYDEPQFGDVAEKARRIMLLLDAYGLPQSQRGDVVSWIRRRAQSAFDTVEVLGKQGVPGYVQLYEQQLHHAGLPLISLESDGTELQSLIDAG
jgi:Ser/Thr protein kinase RdoA (MazF antagonist)